MAISSPEKCRVSDAGEEDIACLEGKFKEIISEMTDLRSARALTATYERLRFRMRTARTSVLRSKSRR
jgi:hypothetical protein